MRKLASRIRAAILAIRTTWAIVGVTLLLLAFSEGSLRLIFWAKDLRGIPAIPDPRVLEQGYKNEGWAIEHFRELEQLEDRWQPFVYFRQKPFSGRTIRVDSEGLRATWSSDARPSRGRKRVKILFLGGSSLWGFGARDEHTIPSYVAREIDRRGMIAEVRNLAEIGYVNSQELIALIGELQAGGRPDYAIFYDGVNDTTSALLDGTAGVTTNESNRRREFNILQSPARLFGNSAAHLLKQSASLRFAQSIRRRFGSGIATAYPAPSAEEKGRLADGVVERYRANIGLIQSLGKTYGFKPFFFWQPTVFDKPKRAPYEAEEKEKYAWTEAMFEAVYRRIRESDGLKQDPGFHDLSGIFADEPGLIYIDYCHTTEAANERIATAMVEDLMKVIGENQADPDTR